MSPYKLLRKLFIKAFIVLREKKYGVGYKKIKYLLQKNPSDTLIVVFSGFSAENEKPKYNYVRSLRKVLVNKLFILDDFGYGQRGTYYLGEDGVFFVEELVDQLISNLKKSLNVQRLICLGSSKGGSAAIYYGFKHKAKWVIAGAPQFYIGDYLKVGSHKEILKKIMGSLSDQSIEYLNQLLPNAIKNSDLSTEVFLHYSTNDKYTYEKHVIDLIAALDAKGIKVHHHIDDYKNHNDVAISFPGFATKVLNEKTT